MTEYSSNALSFYAIYYVCVCCVTLAFREKKTQVITPLLALCRRGCERDVSFPRVSPTPSPSFPLPLRITINHSYVQLRPAQS